MSLDPAYQHVYDEAHHLQYQVHDAIDNHDHPSARLLQQELHHLHEDIEMRKNPRDIENRIKAVQHTMLEARSQPHSFMSSNHADHFHRTYEDMRRNIRGMNDYS